MRAVVGIVVGLLASLVGAVIVGVVAFLATVSLPAGTDAADMHQVAAVLTNLPLATQLALAVAWLASAFCGGAVAGLIGRRPWAAWAVVLVVTLYFALDAFILPLAVSAKAAWILAPLLGGLIGTRMVRDRAAPEAVTVEAGDAPAEL